MSIYVTRPSMPDYEEYIQEIKPIFESHQLTNMGPEYKKLQHMLIDYLEVEQVSLFANGHMALEYMIEALGMKIPGAEIITTPFTFASTVHAISRCGLKPVFCDIKLDDYTLDADKITDLVTDKTIAVLPVHVYGNVCDVVSIGTEVARNGLKIIYDAAHAFGVKYMHRGVGTFGDATMFSFHATKVFNSIEGGAVTFRNTHLKEPLHSLKNFGIKSEECIDRIGGNAKLDEFRAAMGVCNLRHIDAAIASRKEVAEIYDSYLKDVSGIVLNKPDEGTQQNYAYYPIRIVPEDFGCTRDDVYEELKKNDIFARKYFYPAVNNLVCYQNIEHGDTPISDMVSRQILTLPIYEGLSHDDAERICEIILSMQR